MHESLHTKSLRAIQVPPEGHYVHPLCSAKTRDPGLDGCIQPLWVWWEGFGEYRLQPQVICWEGLQGTGTTVIGYLSLDAPCRMLRSKWGCGCPRGLYSNLLEYSHLNCVLHVGVCRREDTHMHTCTDSPKSGQLILFLSDQCTMFTFESQLVNVLSSS